MSSPKDCKFLHCPECGKDLIPSIGRGRYDQNENEIRHADSCRCRWCSWWWRESDERFPCECGFVGEVQCEDGIAFVREASHG